MRFALEWSESIYNPSRTDVATGAFHRKTEKRTAALRCGREIALTEYYETLSANDGTELKLLFAEPAGEARGVLCLVHGLGDHSGFFSHMIEYFTAASFCAAAIDLHGHGASGGVRGHIENLETFYDDIDLLIARAKLRFPGLPVFLYGHSLGGNLVLNDALRRRPGIAAVIAAAPWLELAEKPLIRRFRAYVFDLFAPERIFRSGIGADKLTHDPEVIARYNGDRLAFGRVSAHLFASAIRSGRWAVRHADQFPLPLLLMHGDADRLTDIRTTERFYRRVSRGDAAFKIWPGGYHTLHNELNRREVYDCVLAFIEPYAATAARRGGAGA